jgi:hypothetical protein
MAGPVLWAILGVGDAGRVIDVARKIAIAITSRGYGAIFGAPQIGRWDAMEGRNLEAVERELGANLSVSITDHPLQTSAFDIFRSELGAVRKNTHVESKIEDLVLELVRMEGISGLAFVVSMEPWISEGLPRILVSPQEFISRLSEYGTREADSSREYGGDGIFIMKLGHRSEPPPSRLV